MSRVKRNGKDAGLHPALLLFLERCEKLPFDTLLVWGGRTPAQQRALYAQGRTVPGPGVSVSRPLGSTVTDALDISDTAHGRFAALDLVPIARGVPDWDDKTKFYLIGDLAESMGLEWGGRFTKLKRLSGGRMVRVPFFDGGHVQVKGWRSLPVLEDSKEVA